MTPIPLGILDFPTGGGTHELIETIDVTSAVSSVAFNDIPQDFAFLELTYNLMGGSGEYVLGYFNDLTIFSGSVTHITGTTTSPVASIYTANWCAFSTIHSDSYATTTAKVLIANYNVHPDKTYLTSFVSQYAGSDRYIGIYSGNWNTVANMTSLGVAFQSSQIAAGSSLSLWGIRGE